MWGSSKASECMECGIEFSAAKYHSPQFEPRCPKLHARSAIREQLACVRIQLAPGWGACVASRNETQQAATASSSHGVLCT
mmetsp:Transcript_9565/g.20537  ORF Transcript_9565/g.20537 Transcript_9565/m.20537 type:complete len:81 (+) Transcript_9565:131-373(+)